MVTIPLYQSRGWWHPVNDFYGVALYNGATGELTIADTAEKVAEIPGPVYPMSLARTQRVSLAAEESWWDMTVAGISGYVAASSNTEVQLRAAEGTDSDYVTTLTPRGSSKSIVGVAHIPATTAVPGQMNTLTVALLPDGQTRASNAALEDALRTRYAHITDIATGNLEIFEVTAATDGKWVMTLGRSRAVSYRAYVTADGSSITLIDRHGNVVAQTGGGEDSDGGLVAVPGSDLSTLTAEELTELGQAILDELAHRAAATK